LGAPKKKKQPKEGAFSQPGKAVYYTAVLGIRGIGIKKKGLLEEKVTKRVDKWQK